jgi:hypothetical protein
VKRSIRKKSIIVKKSIKRHSEGFMNMATYVASQ